MSAPVSPITTAPAASVATSNAGLENLRDIHLPEPVGWWPPAPGWWIVTALIIVGIIALGMWLLRRTRARRYRKLALQQLQMIYRNWQHEKNDAAFAQATNRLLKQTALAAFPADDVAALNGADWLDFLDRKLRKPRFTEPDVRALATLYLREPKPIAVAALHDAAKQWIRSHRC
ncbi:MAG: DUF4381 domain-containing protein [Spongiibacteraceae bacterium]